ncbi:hypothetical protein ACFPOD_03810 [Nitratireductor kimnyeongensis]|uniref:Uncharacterized protein n=1 Tax=Nitratireductor kimnyeongensis TaxID=430679 RepID=A0ABW0T6G6_9HYPH|nr:hypothetical protein [Nitratireductor kimnyeongensis]QZZ34773.1 hypothetical protein KW403_13375 [Nitratireductor kimnyeongensis]
MVVVFHRYSFAAAQALQGAAGSSFRLVATRVSAIAGFTKSGIHWKRDHLCAIEKNVVPRIESISALDYKTHIAK